MNYWNSYWIRVTKCHAPDVHVLWGSARSFSARLRFFCRSLRFVVKLNFIQLPLNIIWHYFGSKQIACSQIHALSYKREGALSVEKEVGSGTKSGLFWKRCNFHGWKCVPFTLFSLIFRTEKDFSVAGVVYRKSQLILRSLLNSVLATRSIMNSQIVLSWE